MSEKLHSGHTILKASRHSKTQIPKFLLCAEVILNMFSLDVKLVNAYIFSKG